MAITIPTSDVVVQYLLAVYRNRFPGRDLSTESYLGKQARAEAMALFQLMQAVVSADNDSIPNQSMSSQALDNWAIAIGLVSSSSNGTITYGRKQPTNSLGTTAPVTGTNSTSVPSGSLAVASDGVTQFLLDNGGGPLVIPGSAPGTGSITGSFDSVSSGTVSNLIAGAVLTWQNPPSGLDPTVKVTAGPTSLAIDTESDSQLLERILTKMQSPAKGGAASDYRVWCESVSGVARAFVFPLRGGLGSVNVLLTGSGSGTPNSSGSNSRLPTAAVQTGVLNYINGSGGLTATRPVTVNGFKALLPYMPSYGTGAIPSGSGGLTIRARLVPSKVKYAFDWDDTSPSVGSTYTATSYVSGTNGASDTFTLTQSVPITLANANTNNASPRIQMLVKTAGAPAVPIQVQVAGISGSTITLQNPLPSGWVPPANGDTTVIYAGGPMVTPIGTALLSYADGIGPKRGSYADPLDGWEDTIAIDRIVQICLDTEDTDGTRFAKNAVGGGLANVTVANGTNAASSSDVTASDGGTDTTIEILWSKWIAVTQ